MKIKKPGKFQNPMYESARETCSQTNSISLHVTTPVKLWYGQEPLNQTDKAKLWPNSNTPFQSMVIKIYCTLKVKEANSNDVDQ